jgi:hypothetical protein
LSEAKYNALLEAAKKTSDLAVSLATTEDDQGDNRSVKRKRSNSNEDTDGAVGKVCEDTANHFVSEQRKKLLRDQGGAYSVSEAQAAYSHLSEYHKKKGWDTSGWWARKG